MAVVGDGKLGILIAEVLGRHLAKDGAGGEPRRLIVRVRLTLTLNPTPTPDPYPNPNPNINPTPTPHQASPSSSSVVTRTRWPWSPPRPPSRVRWPTPCCPQGDLVTGAYYMLTGSPKHLALLSGT